MHDKPRGGDIEGASITAEMDDRDQAAVLREVLFTPTVDSCSGPNRVVLGESGWSQPGHIQPAIGPTKPTPLLLSSRRRTACQSGDRLEMQNIAGQSFNPPLIRQYVAILGKIPRSDSRLH